MTVDELNKRFAILGVLSFDAGPGGLARANIRAAGASASIMLHGAHLTHYQPDGQEPVLWMSQKSWFEPGKPIRGGVPICFPWFGGSGPAGSPIHGVVRLRAWEFISARVLADGRVEAVLATRSDDETRKFWPHDFVLKFTVTVGPSLTMALNTTNIGDAPFEIAEALHTYFAVSDIHRVMVRGLENHRYIDTAGGTHAERQQGDEPITFAAECDRDYVAAAGPVVLDDPGMSRRITIDKRGSESTVVWNPWTAKAARMPDFGDEEWPGMLCIETANIGDDAVTIKPGKSHTMEATITAKPMLRLEA